MRFENMRKAGILMPVASLPGRHGCGSFGADAYRFIDLAAKAGFSIWQILPLNPLGYGNSPYPLRWMICISPWTVSLKWD